MTSSEFERLSEFYPFSDDVLERVERAAHRQDGLSWPEYQRRFNIPEPKIFRPRDGKPIEVVDLNSDRGQDVIVYHQPMACILDSNILSHVATLAAAQSEHRIIAVGNPGQLGRGSGKLSVAEAVRVWRGDFQPTVAPTLEYLNSQSITEASHVGESYGADKAIASAVSAEIYDSRAVRSIMVEPVSVVKAGIIKMGMTFMSTGKQGDRYLEPVRSRSSTFVSAEELRYKPWLYPFAMARLSNLAVAHALGLNGFENRVQTALSEDWALKIGIAWGTHSEFDETNRRGKIVSDLRAGYGADRVASLPLERQTHAMNLDIFLNAAIYSELLAETA